MNITVERTPSGKYILRLNASLYKESNCMRKLWWTMFRGLVPNEGASDFKMEYGTAFHKAMFGRYSGWTLEKCIEVAFNHYSQPHILVPDSDWRTVSHLVNTVMMYFNHYQKQGDLIQPSIVDGKPMLEMSFQYPFYTTPQTDLLLCGTIDFKGMYANVHPVIVDHKTTSLNQKESYLNSYCLSPQLMTYKMMYEILFPGEHVSCMINGIFLNRTNKNDFMRSSLIDFTPAQMQRHERNLLDTARKIVESFNSIIDVEECTVDMMFPENYTCCNQQYGMCSFLPLCLAANNSDREGIISTSYGSRIYDPSKFQA